MSRVFFKMKILTICVLCCLLVLKVHVETSEAHSTKTLKVVVVGDTGIGERGYEPAFNLIDRDMRRHNADAILHLGDFVYQPSIFNFNCDERYIQKIESSLVRPYPVRLFVMGDNDFSAFNPFDALRVKPKASSCWEKILPFATRLDDLLLDTSGPRSLEGVSEIHDALFVLLNVYDWQDPSPWLKPIIDRARREGKWVVFALHEPPITSSWKPFVRPTLLKQIHALKPDLVLSGNQHSYERFLPFRNLGDDFTVSDVTKDAAVFRQDAGPIFMVTGGGGAKLKPFAAKKKIPDYFSKTIEPILAERALMFHYLSLEISHDTLTVTTHKVCPPLFKEDRSEAMWKPDKKSWEKNDLACNENSKAVETFEKFSIRK